MVVQEHSLFLPQAWAKVAYQEYAGEDQDGLTYVAFHGWLDNSNSFGPLVEKGGLKFKRFVAVDLPGHGLSGHLPKGAHYHFIDCINIITEVLGHLYKDEPKVLVGHSLGASAMSMYTSLVKQKDFKDKFEGDTLKGQVLIEGIGPYIIESNQAFDQYLKYFNDYWRKKKLIRDFSLEKAKKHNFEDMVRKRAYISKISEENAKLLVSRNWHTEEERFLTDQRLKRPSALMMTQEQVLSFVEHMALPTLLIEGRESWLKDLEFYRERKKRLKVNQTKVKELVLDGNHHLHMEDAPRVGAEIQKFVSSL